MKLQCVLVVLASFVVCFVDGHGHIVWPPSRNGGTLAAAGHCDNEECVWFSQPAVIPGKPTLPLAMRSVNVHVEGGPLDWSATMPWRAPGTAAVLGSGCGVGGGNKVPLPNGGGIGNQQQGMDGLLLAKLKQPPVVWAAGSVQEVGFAITANHGGGYSWRLCPADGKVSEKCFQQTVLRFASDTQQLQYDEQTYQYNTQVKLPRFDLPLKKTSVGTFPPFSEWARVPMPACRLCDQSICGPGLLPNLTESFILPVDIYGPNATAFGGLKWFEQQVCAQSCSGLNLTACPPGMLQFDEPLNGISGYTLTYPPVGRTGFPYSVIDTVKIPHSLQPGAYLLSWRWDCEQSHQVWQNCADVNIVQKIPL